MNSCFSLGALLVFAVLVPEPFAQLGVRLFHRSLAQLARNDVVVTAIRYVARRAAGAGTAFWPPAADTATATLLAAFPLDATRRAGFITRGSGSGAFLALAILALTILPLASGGRAFAAAVAVTVVAL